MNKKAQQSFTLIQYIPRTIFLIVALFSVIFLIRGYVVDSLNVQQVQAEVFFNRILYSPSGILYHDADLNRATPGIIDPKLVTDSTLDKLMDYKMTDFVAGHVELEDVSGDIVASATYNNKTYIRWLVLVGASGAGGVQKYERDTVVTYMQDTITKPGILKIIALLPGGT